MDKDRFRTELGMSIQCSLNIVMPAGEKAAKAANGRPLHPQNPQTAARLFLHPAFHSILPHTLVLKISPNSPPCENSLCP